MNNKYLLTALTSLVAVAVMFAATKMHSRSGVEQIAVGFVYIGDRGTAYTNNFFRAQVELEDALGGRVRTIAKFNIKDSGGECEKAIESLVSDGCSLIFTTSYGYGEATKKMAQKYPAVQFCHASGDTANKEPVLANFHNFMGKIYEGRYVSGVVAGLKMRELIDSGKIRRSGAKIGYVAAFPYPEVISGYTAFFLGVRSVVGEAEMTVRYTNTWGNHVIEKKTAEKLIEEGCVIVSQHSDTTGSAIACEEESSKRGKTVFHVGYNQSMSDVAPTTSLVSSRINWTPYVVAASEAVLAGKRIESTVKTDLHGNDAAAEFADGWVEVIGLNRLIAADGTEEEIGRTVRLFKDKRLSVFSGNYTGVNPFDAGDTWDLREPFTENETASAPQFRYVLRDVITVEE